MRQVCTKPVPLRRVRCDVNLGRRRCPRGIYDEQPCDTLGHSEDFGTEGAITPYDKLRSRQLVRVRRGCARSLPRLLSFSVHSRTSEHTFKSKGRHNTDRNREQCVSLTSLPLASRPLCVSPTPNHPYLAPSTLFILHPSSETQGRPLDAEQIGYSRTAPTGECRTTAAIETMMRSDWNVTLVSFGFIGSIRPGATEGTSSVTHRPLFLPA